MRLTLTSIVAAGVLALAGCGDGGDGEAQTTSTSPEQASYPANVVNNFMTNCERTSNGNTAGCQCILDELERQFTLAEFTKEDQAVAKGEEPSKKFTDAVATCR